MNYDVLKSRLYTRLRYTVTVFLIAVGVIGFTLYDVFARETDLGMQVFNWVLIGISFLIAAFVSYVIIGAIIDLVDIKNKKQYKMRAKFVSYMKKQTTKGVVTYEGQVFLNLETNKEEMLDVLGVEPGKTYTILYTKHSKQGIPISKGE